MVEGLILPGDQIRHGERKRSPSPICFPENSFSWTRLLSELEETHFSGERIDCNVKFDFQQSNIVVDSFTRVFRMSMSSSRSCRGHRAFQKAV